MRKKLILGVVFLLVSVIIIPISANNIEPTFMQSADGNILYVGGSGGDNYTKIQDAINDANPGDTVFVFNGTYYENLKVGKSINLRGENKDSTVIDGDYIHNLDVVKVSADWVNISGFTIRKSYFCIMPRAGLQICSNYNTITGNIISDNGNGIALGFFGYSSSNNITNNNISSNYNGINLYYSDSNTITSNNISKNGHGIWLYDSKFNLILKNNFLDNEQDAYFSFEQYSRNRWNQNFWGSPRILPKLIRGEIEIFDNIIWLHIWIPWINIDWHPAKEPYDIGV